MAAGFLLQRRGDERRDGVAFFFSFLDRFDAVGGVLELGDDLVGAPPVQPNLKMRLHAAAVPRLTPLSGWDLEVGVPKGTRFLAPAGSVYFFDEVVGRRPGDLWMQPVSDGVQERLDGFGLAICGGW